MGKWGAPLVTNVTFLIGPLYGALMDRSGFAIPAMFLLISTQLCLLCLWQNNPVAEWLTLFLLCSLNAGAYSIQFGYLIIAYPAEMYAGLLSIVLFVQGLLGFVAWPVLSALRPFGSSWGTYIAILILPTVPLYAWPWMEAKAHR